MANTQITLTLNEGILVPSASSVPVTSGDTIAFATADGSAAYLFFSPDAAAALSPSPSSPLEVSAGSEPFTFTTSEPGAYAVFFETSASAPATPFPVSPSNELLLEIDYTGVTFSGQDNNTHR
jgi:plastocyanin